MRNRNDQETKDAAPLRPTATTTLLQLASAKMSRPMRSLTLLLVLLLPQGVSAMAFFDIGKVCVFSEVHLYIAQDGVPLRNTKVTRRWHWSDYHSDEATTDDSGYVEFPAKFERSASRLLPIELVIGQQIEVEIDNETQIIWGNSKREPEENSELDGLPLNLTCDLTHDEILIEDFSSPILTKCKLEARNEHNGT